MKTLNLDQMEVIQGGMKASSAIFCGLSIVGYGLSLASLIAAPNPLSAVGYAVSTASVASCFV